MLKSRVKMLDGNRDSGETDLVRIILAAGTTVNKPTQSAVLHTLKSRVKMLVGVGHPTCFLLFHALASA